MNKLTVDDSLKIAIHNRDMAIKKLEAEVERMKPVHDAAIDFIRAEINLDSDDAYVSLTRACENARKAI